MKIYFEENEFMMGGKEPVYDKMNEDILQALNIIRHKISKPLVLTSTYRSEEYNKSVGGAKHSQHVLGNAADISIENLDGHDVYLIIKILISLDLSFGINWNKKFIHMDCRSGNPITFKY